MEITGNVICTFDSLYLTIFLMLQVIDLCTFSNLSIWYES